MRRLLAATVLVAVALAACSPAASTPGGSATPDTAAARAYCTEKGGMLVDRAATWNTNADPPAWLQLAGRMTFCEFETGQGDGTTRIAVDLVTLHSTEPTLAAIAYLSKVPPVLPETPSENPAAYNCAVGLGGASAFGNTATAGGWVDTTQPIFTVMNMCFFADGSAIDEFGIFYYATGAIRGADLAPILRYQPGDKLPAMYEEGRRR